MEKLCDQSLCHASRSDRCSSRSIQSCLNDHDGSHGNYGSSTTSAKVIGHSKVDISGPEIAPKGRLLHTTKSTLCFTFMVFFSDSHFVFEM